MDKNEETDQSMKPVLLQSRRQMPDDLKLKLKMELRQTYRTKNISQMLWPWLSLSLSFGVASLGLIYTFKSSPTKHSLAEIRSNDLKLSTQLQQLWSDDEGGEDNGG